MLKISIGKILAIDFGENSTGLAVSDEKRLMVFPKGVIDDYKSLEEIFWKISLFCQEEQISMIVFGVPIEEEGQEPIQSERFRSIGKRLEKYLRNVPVEFEDEAFTSFEAENILKGYDFNRLRKKYSEHEISAMIILERYLSNKK